MSNTERVKLTMNKGKRAGKIIMSVGLILVFASFSLAAYNYATETRAANISEKIFSLLDSVVFEDLPEVPDYVINPDMDLPAKEIDGINYVGTLTVPVLELNLPVIDHWSYDNFKISPCVYEGTPYLNNFIVCAHNYRKHFGSLINLKQGDNILFNDMDGNTFTYEVLYTEILDNEAVDEMSAGDWDLTLFTCTYGGATRITVRCKLIDESIFPLK